MREGLVAGRYRVVRRLGSGGMATVVLAEDELLGRRVALKQLHAEGGDELAGRLAREARIGASLDHPNVVQTYDVLSGDHGPLIVMEHVDGGSLADAVRDGPLPPARAVAVLRQVASALDHAHERGVVHRDVKPANVLLRRDGRAKLADLGIAMAADAGTTTAGAALGSVAYMAPEQLDGRTVTAAADVHALAAVAFELLTGRRARAGGTPAELAARAARGGPPDVRAAWPGAPPALAAVLARAMAPDPAARHPTATAFVEDLAAVLGVGQGPAQAAAPAAAAPAAAATPPAAQQPARAAAPAEPVARREPRPPAPAAAPASRPPAGRRRTAPLVALAAAALAAGALAAALLTGGEDVAPERAATTGGTAGPAGDGAAAGDGGRGADTPTSSDAGAEDPAPGAGGAPGARAADPAPGAGAAGSSSGSGSTGTAEPDAGPAAAVRAFYAAAAAQDAEAVCSRLGPTLRARFTCAEFTGQFRTLRQVTFERLEPVGQAGGTATVELRTTARHTDRTERCRGTARLMRSGGRWLVDGLSVSCERS